MSSVAVHIALKACIALLLKLMNILVHGLGYYLLRAVQKENRLQMIQMVYIANLSIIELLINILSFLRNLLKITGVRSFAPKEFSMLFIYSYILDYAVLKFCLYMTMIILTLDRLFLITLNVNYTKHINVNKARYVVRLTWVAGFLLFVLASCLFSVHVSTQHRNDVRMPSDYNVSVAIASSLSFTNSTDVDHTGLLELAATDTGNLFFIINFASLTFDIIFLVCAAVSYSLIFHVYKRRQRKNALRRQQTPSVTSTREDGKTEKLSLWRTFRQSRFYVSLLLIMTFVVFVIPADISWTVNSLSAEKADPVVETLTTISYALSYLSDGLIYIFMNPKVKELLMRKLRRLKILKEPSDNRGSSSFCETEQTVHAGSVDKDKRRMTNAQDVNGNCTTGLIAPGKKHCDVPSVKSVVKEHTPTDEVCKPLMVGEFEVTIMPKSDTEPSPYPMNGTVGNTVLYSKCPIKDCPFEMT